MRKTVALLLFAFCLLIAQTAFAGLDEKRSEIVAKYGEYRMVVDDNGQIWTKANWETGGSNKETASAYIYHYMAKDVKVQLDVQYIEKYGVRDPYVRAQRFTPDWAIQVKELKIYFPDIYALVTDPESKVFTTREKVTKNMLDEKSPVVLAVKCKELKAAHGMHTLVVFNVKGEGTLIKDAKQINGDTYISEIILERMNPHGTVGMSQEPDWQYQNNIFIIK